MDKNNVYLASKPRRFFIQSKYIMDEIKFTAEKNS